MCSKVPGASQDRRRRSGRSRSASSSSLARVSRPKKVSIRGATKSPPINRPPSNRASLSRSTWATGLRLCSSSHCSARAPQGRNTASCKSSARLRWRPAVMAAREPIRAATNRRVPTRAPMGRGQSRLAAASQVRPQLVPRLWASKSVGGINSTRGLARGPNQRLKPPTTPSPPRAKRVWRGSREGRQRRNPATITPQTAKDSTKWPSQVRGRGRRFTRPK